MNTPLSWAGAEHEIAQIRADWKQADQRNGLVQARIQEALEGVRDRCGSDEAFTSVCIEISLFERRCDEINGTDNNPW